MKRKIRNSSIWAIVGAVIPILLVLVALTGEIKCIIKAVKCDWGPIGKAEIIYTASSLCGAGAIVGWINIEDD